MPKNCNIMNSEFENILIKSHEIGKNMHDLMVELFPICRSITGNGVRDSLQILQNHIQLDISEIPSGTEVFDWTIPREWNIRDAFIKNSKGEKIELPINSTNSKIFHAGTKLNNNNIYSNGGRVLCATALGKDIQQAQTKAYEFLEKVDWQGAYYRTDIGFKSI